MVRPARNGRPCLGRLFLFLAALSLPLGATALNLDERPATAGEWGYRPADGTQPETNPPAFTWRPVEEADFYQLQVSATIDFTAPIYVAPSIEWTAHCPNTILEPGKYFWRYRAANEKRRGRKHGKKEGKRESQVEYSNWSQIRSFTVATEAIHFPQPSASELSARIPQTHPRLLIEPSELDGLRELAKDRLAAQWKELAGEAEELLRNPPKSKEPPKYPEGMKPRGEEWKKIWWGNHDRMIEITNGAATLAFAGLLGGKKQYTEAARKLLVDFGEWDPKGSTSYEYNDEAAMPALYYGARAADWSWNSLPDKDRRKLVSVMKHRGEQCFDHLIAEDQLWHPYESHENRAWHFLGETAIAFYDEIPEAPIWLDYAMTVMYTTYPVWGGDDGGWHEGIYYWNSYMERFMYWGDAVRSGFGINMFERPFFKETGYFGMYVMPPGTHTGGFGDLSPSMGATGIADLMYTLAIGARNPQWMWHAQACGGNAGKGYMGYLRSAWADKVRAETPTNLPSSRLFRDAGLAVMNTDLLNGNRNIQVMLKSSPYGSQSHGYNAQNSFVVHARGRGAFISTGRRDVYGSPHHEGWMWSTRSDNAILVNGRGQKKHTAEISGKISAWFTSPQLDLATGETRDAYGSDLERWRRRIIFLKPSIVVIHDLLDAPEPSTFTWLLHAPGEFQIQGEMAKWVGETDQAGVRFLWPKGLGVSQTDKFDPPPASWVKWKLNEWHLSAETPGKKQHQEFITVLNINAPEPKAELQHIDKGWTLKLDIQGRPAHVELNNEGYRVRWDGVEKELRD